MDVDRVACFHGTVHGYSSLLYELRHDSGFEDFMRCLQKLWRALDSDETLPQKLVSSAGAGPLHPPAFLPSRSGCKLDCAGQMAPVWGHHCSSCYPEEEIGGNISDVSVLQQFTAVAETGVAQVSPGHCEAFQCDVGSLCWWKFDGVKEGREMPGNSCPSAARGVGALWAVFSLPWSGSGRAVQKSRLKPVLIPFILPHHKTLVPAQAVCPGQV